MTHTHHPTRDRFHMSVAAALSTGKNSMLHKPIHYVLMRSWRMSVHARETHLEIIHANSVVRAASESVCLGDAPHWPERNVKWIVL